MNQRLARINELLRREIADALFREMNDTGFDAASVSITRVEVASSLRRATVFVSVFGDERHRASMLSLLRHHRVHLQQFINRDLVLKYTPVLTFVPDASIAEGDRVLRILEELPEPTATAGEDEGEEEPPVS